MAPLNLLRAFHPGPPTMKLVALLASLSLLSAVNSLVYTRQSSAACRCTSDQPCWPSTSDFESLASQVSQPLIYPVPPESACYPGFSGNCTEVRQQWTNSTYVSGLPGAMMDPTWETYTFPNNTIDACYFNTSLGVPCGQGSVPTIGVDARTVADVQAAVNFAAKYNLRLVIKNTGTARGSFLIWTHNLKNITFHNMFTPLGGNILYDNVFTLEAGVQWYEAYAAADAQNLLLVGAASGTVGAAGGWVQGGGHSILSVNYGLGVDNVLEMTIVTADGLLRTVNEYTDADLFWALRGGGGGTYGVVMSVSYKSHPSNPVSAVVFSITPTASIDLQAMQNVVTEFISLTADFVEYGFGGETFGNVTGGSYTGFLVSPNVTLAQTNQIFQPFFDYARSLSTLTVVNFTSSYSNFSEWYQVTLGSNPRIPANIGDASWLLPADVIINDPVMVGEKFMQLTHGFGFQYQLVAGGAVSRVDPNAMGLNPAWRDALGYVTMGYTWPEGATWDTTTMQRISFEQDMLTMVSIAPNSGSYFNEASRFNFNPQRDFFGSHYQQLNATKFKYDPEGMFIVWSGVGSDVYDLTLNCLL